MLYGLLGSFGQVEVACRGSLGGRIVLIVSIKLAGDSVVWGKVSCFALLLILPTLDTAFVSGVL
jgi:hypothetical protein